MSEEFDRERAHELMHNLMHTDRMHRTVVENFASSMGVHRSQHMLLMYLGKCGGNASQKQIADSLGISAAAVAVTLKKLESGGFITKSVRDADSRFNEVNATDKGRALAASTKELFDKLDYAMFSQISDDEYSVLFRCFEKMQDGLKKFGAEGIRHCN